MKQIRAPFGGGGGNFFSLHELDGARQLGYLTLTGINCIASYDSNCDIYIRNCFALQIQQIGLPMVNKAHGQTFKAKL